jgi:N-acetylglucosamine-6-phosphate deacetylase
VTDTPLRPEYPGPDGGVLTCETLITPGVTLRPGWIHLTAGTVTALGAGTPPRPVDRQLPSGSLVIPGLVDTHVHGGGGHAMTIPDEREVSGATAYHLQHGTTATIVSLITAPTQQLLDSLELVADLVERGAGRHGRVLGSHLEGPYLSSVRRGAHSAAHLRHPTRTGVEALLEAGRGTLRMLTFAPELPGTLGAGGLIRQLRDHGVTAAVGHTDASYDDTRQALADGATAATHLFNGMRPIHHREPGPIAALLADDDTSCELINDGVHVHPGIARLAARLLGAGRLVLITDAVSATGAPDGEYLLGQTPIVRRGGTIRTADGTSLGGSDLTMAEALRRAVAVLGLDIADAVAATTVLPAQAVGCAATAGSLSAGRSADLVVLDGDLRVQAVMVAGAWMKRPPEPTPITAPARMREPSP